MPDPAYNPYAPPQGYDHIQPAPPQYFQFRAAHFEPASRGARFLADLVDRVVVFAPAMALAIVGAIIAGAFDVPDGDDLENLAIFGSMVVGILVGGAAEIWSQIAWSQSIGKRLCGIKVIHTNGQPPTVVSIVFRRNLSIVALQSVCSLVSLVDPILIFSDDRRCLHDRIADTMVVKAS